MPAKSSYPKASGVPIGDMPSVQITKSDHHETASHGRQGDDGKRYRAAQTKMIKSGQFRKAMAADIRDLRKIAKDNGDPKKYDQAIKEMRAYAKCLEKEGVL